ncbi:JAB domain-containing protein similar to deubiquitination enzymes [Fontibacillus phaseoli]|uniref:JAB domain-containing protein similar to deubiquitination enzymes n=1 Tax=Fontibacillus phaseoli TaxID=1416533 RepID=A0A369BJD2_9BACL|nr:M67 family metallopeptidase [Fontibacillus phaseoli]RCX21709.1 JAB domain-containing protein similar to deubiquitination enzymes [Fontibacillus phaseoli]
MTGFSNADSFPTLLQLPVQVRTLLEKDYEDRYPKEACGALFGHLSKETVIAENYLPLSNIAEDPRHAFAFDPVEWVRCCYAADLIGIYHSHPTSLPVPSSLDIQELQHFGSLLSVYLIGGRTTKEKPSGNIPDGFYVHAYSVVRRNNEAFSLRNLIMSC